jgi:hypothetical protein
MPNDSEFDRSYPPAPMPEPNTQPQPAQPVQPAQPAQPIQPAQPVQPTQPARPTQETWPMQPVQGETRTQSFAESLGGGKMTNFVDTAANVVNTARKVRAIISIISAVVALIVLAVVLLNNKNEVEQQIEETKQEQAAIEEKENKRKVTLTIDGKSFDVYPTFGKTIRSALENDIPVYRYTDSSAEKKTITNKNVDRVLSTKLENLSGIVYDYVSVYFGDESNDIMAFSTYAAKNSTLNDLTIDTVETVTYSGSLKINGKEISIRSNTLDDFMGIFGQPNCKIENYDSLKDRATEESDDSALVYDIGNDIFLVGEFNKAKNNVLRCVKIDFFGKTKQYCPKTN